MAHSLTSTQPVCGEPLNPGGQLSPQSQEPGVDPSFHATSAAQPPLLTAQGFPAGWAGCCADERQAPTARPTTRTTVKPASDRTVQLAA